ncbi:BTAD domain-containing putative transcriptional regulator [Micromonospora avicenniae]|uniref:BTAD domain-containing putative transcriptional regulator n=1 Tax=Micromonospora avicenniae TaxID=1198245 RepID=UPI001FE56BF0|nr:BTAD domain-containing putative transcriptional regulator [Micromonospora avicenniae]
MPEVPSSAAVRQWIAEPMGPDLIMVLAGGGVLVLWLLLATAVLMRAYTALARRLRATPAFRLPGPVQGLAAALLGTTAVTTVAGAAAHAGPPAAAATVDGDAQASAARSTATAQSDRERQETRSTGQPSVYTVERGDSLSKIAKRQLGDADRWPEIFALNRGHRFPDVGGTLRDPNVIRPGWTLKLPADDPGQPGPGSTPRWPSTDSPNPPPPDGTDMRPPAGPTLSPTPGSANTTAPTPGSNGATEPDCVSGNGADAADSAANRSHEAGETTRGVRLPSGSWLDLGVALAIAAAVALVWAHRQRRYVPGKPSTRPRLDDADLRPMPHVVQQIRHGLRRVANGNGMAHQDAGHPADEAVDEGTQPTQLSDIAGLHQANAPTEDGSRGSASRDDDAPDAGDLVPALAYPLAAWPPAGLGLIGPGAEAAARGLLIAALAADTTPDARTQVVIPAATATALLGVAAINLPRTPRMTVTNDLTEALAIVEHHAMYRARLLDQHDVRTVDELRAADPYKEALPPVMLLAGPIGRHERVRVAALLAQGQHLDIHGVLLGGWSDGDSIHVTPDGGVSPADDDSPRGPRAAGVSRLTVLNPAETLDILATLTESHTGHLPASALAEASAHSRPPSGADNAPAANRPSSSTPAPQITLTPSPGTSDDERNDTDARNPNEASDAASREACPPTAGVTATAPTPEMTAAPAHADDSVAARIDGETAAEGSSESMPAIDAPAANTDETPPPAAPQHEAVEVVVLGKPAIIGADPRRALRAKSMELLVYLAACDGDASTEAILDDLLPDAPASKAMHRLHTYISDLRAVLRHNAGPGTYLTRTHHRYQLNTDRFNLDLWRMRAAIRAADTAGSHTERAEALRRAVATYRPLADGCDYEWLEPHRHAVQREALDAATALLEELADQPAEQAAVCETALPHHPYAEVLYQQAMRAHARLGNLDTIRALRRTLTRRLAEIDAEVSDDTLALADRLATDLRQPRRSPRNPRPSDDGASA